MANTELCKFYLNKPFSLNRIPEVIYKDVIKSLDNHFNYDWTWEISDEKLVMDNSVISTTVTVYIPGRVLTGRSLCKIKDYHENHLRAILDAISFMINEKKEVVKKENNETKSFQMTTEEILERVAQNEREQGIIKENQVNTKEQFYNYKNSNGIASNEVPFDNLTNNCNKELEQETFSQKENDINNSQNNSQEDNYNAPQQKYNGFSQSQVDRINAFKKECGVKNDKMFANWVNTWNSNYNSKSDITPENVEEFLSFIEELKKSYR